MIGVTNEQEGYHADYKNYGGYKGFAFIFFDSFHAIVIHDATNALFQHRSKETNLLQSSR